MAQNNELLLIDHLDRQLNPAETLAVETLIREDRSVAAEWAYLHLAVEAVELGAIREQVAAVRQSLNKQAPAAVQQGAVVRSMYRTAMRVAAILIVVLGISVFYKFSIVTNSSVYNQYFTAYDLNTARGSEQGDAMDNAYRSGKWNEVLADFNGESIKTNKSRFLAGMASLELKKFPEAAEQFEQIMAINAQSGSSDFEDEAEYYLALASIMNGQTEKAITLISKIKTNPDHRYYPLAREISSANLKIIELKTKK